MLKKCFDFKVNDSILDKNGPYIVLDSTVYGQRFLNFGIFLPGCLLYHALHYMYHRIYFVLYCSHHRIKTEHKKILQTFA
jgi:hypothetical protein